MNYFISDLHFGHKNCLAYDNRPFQDVDEHDKAIIENWNRVVGKDDDVYILGDISWHKTDKTIEFFEQLKGKLHLIIGNHDKKLLKNFKIRQLFVEVCEYKELYVDNKIGIVLCHYPIVCFKNHYYNWIMLYGHVHNSFEWNMTEDQRKMMKELYDKSCRCYNTGCMMEYMNYTPRTLDEILKYYEGD